jgi:hypothetical protein
MLPLCTSPRTLLDHLFDSMKRVTVKGCYSPAAGRGVDGPAWSVAIRPAVCVCRMIPGGGWGARAMRPG